MRKAGIILLLLLIFLPVMLSAQEGDSDWDYYEDEFTRGDQTFTITLGTAFPTVFFNNGKIDHKLSPPVGGTGSLAYAYFLTPQIFLGAEVAGMFFPTLGSNTVFIIPLGAKGGYQFSFWRFEFPVSLVIGGTWYRYLSQSHYGLYIKGGGSAFYRLNSRWSFGINANWYWLPQWTGNKDENVHGHVVDTTLSARYHF